MTARRLRSRLRRRISAAVALIASCLVLAVGVAERRHEAQVAHVRDSHGTVSHAPQTACAGEATTHLDALPRQDHDAGVCTLIALQQTAGTAAPPQVDVAPPITGALVASAPAEHDHRLDLLLFVAPKTSPPRAA